MLGLYNGESVWQYPIEWTPGEPYGDCIKEAQEIIDQHDLLIGANFKHDLLWCRRYGLSLQKHKVWCVQYAEFILSGQVWTMPDLDTACKNRGLEGKLPWNWSKPFNTYSWQDAARYNDRDLHVEFQLFQKQVELLKDRPQLKRLIWTGCQDLQVTAEMEWNGLKYDTELSLRKGNAVLSEVAGVEARLRDLCGVPPIVKLSPATLSAVLYGGQVTYEQKEPYLFTYKDPKRSPINKTRKVEKVLVFERLVEPLKGSENANGFSTDEGILKRLRATGKARQIIDLLLDIRGSNKLVSTYFHGIPKLAKEFNWENDVIHGQLNHCVTQTGRLASAKPNQQNLDYRVRECLITRFPLKKS